VLDIRKVFSSGNARIKLHYFRFARHPPGVANHAASSQNLPMESLYQCDLAHVHAAAFETLARGAAGEILRRLQSSSAQIRKVMDVGCGAAGFEVTAVDTSAELLELARANVPTANFVHASIYDAQIRDYDAVVAIGEPLTYHPEGGDADILISGFFQRVADTLPPGGLLIFDVIGLGEPCLAGRTWSSGDDWAVLVETTENQTEKSLVRNIEVFRRVRDAYRRSHEVHRVRLFDVSLVCNQLASCGFTTETSRSYGAQQLPPRRHAFFATRLAATGS
jgi:SAM-dependent methyltransferase